VYDLFILLNRFAKNYDGFQNMNHKERINAFHSLGIHFSILIDEGGIELSHLLSEAKIENPWFTEKNVLSAMQNIVSWLDRTILTEWVSSYHIKDQLKPRNIGVIMAGNIPLVGFHDLLSILITGHRAIIKFSHKDKVLMNYTIKRLVNIEPRFEDFIIASDKPMKGVDAMIATGSNNSFRYFDRYFGELPHIFRNNRNGVAVLTNTEAQGELDALAHDIFLYFGLGCRNVSKLYVIESLNAEALVNAFAEYKEIINHNKYGNNYEYQRAVLQLAQTPYVDLNNVLLKEDRSFSSPVGVLHYEIVENLAEAKTKIEANRNQIQVTIGKDFVPFGLSQFPKVSDYADEVDVISFLSQL
jgi:hypothetical protein